MTCWFGFQAEEGRHSDARDRSCPLLAGALALIGAHAVGASAARGSLGVIGAGESPARAGSHGELSDADAMANQAA